jgi:uncharacterized protein (TIGR02246 family)
MDQVTVSRHVERIRELDDSWVAAVRRRDLEGMMTIYASDAQELLPGLPVLIGRDVVRDFYRRQLETLPRFDHAFAIEEAMIAESGDIAVVRGSYRFTFDEDIPEEFDVGKFVRVWVYVSGDWRLQVTISNSDLEP